MSDVEERQFTLHLNDCEGCRTALAGHAAEPEVWREAAELLRTDQLDADDPASIGREQQSVHIQNVLKSLGPTDDPEMLGRLGGYEVSGIVGGFARIERATTDLAAAVEGATLVAVTTLNNDHEAVARALGISVTNSYKRVSRAQAWLKLYILEARKRDEV